MKRTGALLLLALFTFHLGGYRLIFWAMEHQTRTELLARLDAEEYTESETLLLTIPLAMPYPLFQEGFERVNGEFDFQGNHYKLVKQKLEHDTLFVVCVLDAESTHLKKVHAEMDDLAGQQANGSNEAWTYLSKLAKEYSGPTLPEVTRVNLELVLSTNISLTPATVELPYPVEAPPPRA